MTGLANGQTSPQLPRQHFEINQTVGLIMATPQLIAAVNQAIETYEDVVGEYASRTRPMIDRYGYTEALSRIVQSPDLQSGFRALRDSDQLNVTFEAVVVEFAEEFDPRVVAAAQWRLDNADNLL